MIKDLKLSIPFIKKAKTSQKSNNRLLLETLRQHLSHMTNPGWKRNVESISAGHTGVCLQSKQLGRMKQEGLELEDRLGNLERSLEM